MLVNYY